MTDQPRFDDVAGDFVQLYDTLYGWIRTETIHRQLVPLLPPPPVRLLDVGGGGGRQAALLAALGYNVTILDPSEQMRREAIEWLSKKDSQMASRVAVVDGVGEDAADVFGVASFDAVLCHGVLMYLTDPQPFLTSLSRVIRPRGILSLVAHTEQSATIAFADQRMWRDARHAMDSSMAVNHLGVLTRGESVASVSSRLTSVGMETILWHGVRTFIGLSAKDMPANYADRADLLQLELEAGRRDPYRWMSRSVHWIGRRA